MCGSAPEWVWLFFRTGVAKRADKCGSVTGIYKWNGYQFQLEQNELADMFIGIADGTKDETELRYWINDHIE